MPGWKVDTSDLKQNSSELLTLSSQLKVIRSDIQSSGDLSGFTFEGRYIIQKRINELLNSMQKQLSDIENMGEKLLEIAAVYENAENKILSRAGEGSYSIDSVVFDNDGSYSIDSTVFDDEGSYGGDQGNMDETYKWDPIRCWELLGYLREYFPQMSIFEAFGYFGHLNSVGCGYVALANTIFLEYEGRPEEFERVFGYPMYNHGDLNYDRLILDIYVTTDKAGLNDGSDGLPDGTVDESRAQIVEKFLSDKSVGVRTEANADVTADNFRQIAEDGGYVILGYRYGNMYDEKGNAHYINGGHAIVVTGVTDDGKYIVSSWGKKYYINASDIGNDDTFMVFHYDS